jgi:DNA polymerase III epsilon subunit-like protein
MNGTEMNDPTEYTIIDAETVGLKDKRILEVSAIKTNSRFEMISQIEVRTDVKWPEDHISGVVVPTGSYNQEETKKILRNYIGNSIVVGFNLGFERNVFGCVFTRELDIMKEYRKRFPGLPYNLREICLRFGIKQEHRASSDCLALLQILQKF